MQNKIIFSFAILLISFSAFSDQSYEEKLRIRQEQQAKQKADSEAAAAASANRRAEAEALFKSKIDAAINEKIELAAAINPSDSKGNHICLLENKDYSITINGVLESTNFLKWSNFKTDETVTNNQTIYKSLDELLNDAKAGKCFIIVDNAINIKKYLTSFELENKLVKYGPVYSKTAALDFLYKKYQYDSPDDFENAITFGPDGATSEKYKLFKQDNVITNADYKNIVQRMNTTKYVNDLNPKTDLVLTFLQDEKDAKRLKTTTLQLKKVRDKKLADEAAAQSKKNAIEEKKQQAQRAAEEKARIARLQKYKYEAIFICYDEYGVGRDKTLAQNILNAFASGNSQMFAAMLTNSVYSQYCSKAFTPMNNLKLLDTNGTVFKETGTSIYYLLKLDNKTTSGVYGH